jgi:hypothetical protein
MRQPTRPFGRRCSYIPLNDRAVGLATSILRELNTEGDDVEQPAYTLNAEGTIQGLSRRGDRASASASVTQEPSRKRSLKLISFIPS